MASVCAWFARESLRTAGTIDNAREREIWMKFAEMWATVGRQSREKTLQEMAANRLRRRRERAQSERRQVAERGASKLARDY